MPANVSGLRANSTNLRTYMNPYVHAIHVHDVSLQEEWLGYTIPRLGLVLFVSPWPADATTPGSRYLAVRFFMPISWPASDHVLVAGYLDGRSALSAYLIDENCTKKFHPVWLT
jgi:hypothetical protein